MAVAYRSSNSTNTGATPASSIVVNVPAGTQENDALIAAITVDGTTTSTINTPTGWNVIRNTANTTANLRIVVFWRKASATEPANYTWTFDTTRQACGSMLAYSGAADHVPASSAQGTTTTASTTQTAASSNSTYEAGMVFQVFSARNTTAASNLTPGGSYVEREDTCTTASTFVNLEVQEIAKGLTIGSSTSQTATCSQTATGICIEFFLEEARPPFAFLGEDEFSVNSIAVSAGNMTSANFQTNVPNVVVLAFVTINKDIATVSSLSGAAGTWTFVARSNTQAGSTEAWVGFIPTPIGPTTVTVNFSASVISANTMLVGFIGADFSSGDGVSAIGATSAANSTTTTVTTSVTTTRNNSWVWAAANTNTTLTISVGANQTSLRIQTDAANTCQGRDWRQNSITPTSGTSVTMNGTISSAANTNILAIEILSATIRNFGALGVG